MPTTNIAIHHYGHATVSFKISPPLVASASVWSDCVIAINLANFRTDQYPNQTIREPNAWTNPGNNVGNAAAGQAYNAGVLANPHVHGGIGPNHRALLGCRITPATPAGMPYQFMKIYIGEFN